MFSLFLQAIVYFHRKYNISKCCPNFIWRKRESKNNWSFSSFYSPSHWQAYFSAYTVQYVRRPATILYSGQYIYCTSTLYSTRLCYRMSLFFFTYSQPGPSYFICIVFTELPATPQTTMWRGQGAEIRTRDGRIYWRDTAHYIDTSLIRPPHLSY